MNNEKDIDLDTLAAYEHENLVPFCDGSMKRNLGEIYGLIDHRHLATAENWMKKAIASDQKNDMQYNLGLDVAAYAGLLRRKGVPEKRTKKKRKR